jgi:hypothetical protein
MKAIADLQKDVQAYVTFEHAQRKKLKSDFKNRHKLIIQMNAVNCLLIPLAAAAAFFLAKAVS